MASCNWAIAELPGLNENYHHLLKINGINTTHQLLLATQTQRTKHDLAARLNIHPQYVSKWVAMADLARLKSVGVQYCGLILHCGVASVAQLAQTPFNRLHQSIVKLHVANMRRRDLAPSVAIVKQWVAEAKNLA